MPGIFGLVCHIQRSEVLSNEVGEVLQKEEAVTYFLLFILHWLICCHLTICVCSTLLSYLDDPLTEPHPPNFPSEGGSCPNDGAIRKRILTTLIHPSSDFQLFHKRHSSGKGIKPHCACWGTCREWCNSSVCIAEMG